MTVPFLSTKKYIQSALSVSIQLYSFISKSCVGPFTHILKACLYYCKTNLLEAACYDHPYQKIPGKYILKDKAGQENERMETDRIMGFNLLG